MMLAEDLNGNEHDGSYDLYLERLNGRFLAQVSGHHPVFTTDVIGLWDAYLASFPAESRQYHNCNCCRSFIERYGGLVTIDHDGLTTPVLWNQADAGPEYSEAHRELWELVRR